jgi:phosphatidylserine/phosphatidylglycerophosphate/cardiolipin synthase-like enzyme
MLVFGSRTDVVGAIGCARHVELASWLLPPDNPLVAALEDAAERGADVRVALERAPYVPDSERAKKLQSANRQMVRELRRHHVDASLTQKGVASLHLKAAIVDGRAYLAERNWTADEPIVTTTDGVDVAAIADAIAERPHDTADLALRKDRALQLEAALIRDAAPGTAVECETESFGESCVSDALLERARRGEKNLRLMISARALTKRFDRAAAQTLDALRAAGVEIRRSGANEKCCIAGGAAWLGSANATMGQGRTIDWGMRCDDPPVAAALRARFELSWKSSKAL